jgi:hypothetical protein
MLPSHLSGICEPNAAAQPRLEAGAQRTLEGVGCSGLLGWERSAIRRTRLYRLGRTKRPLDQPLLILLLGFPQELEKGMQIPLCLFREGLSRVADFCHNGVFIHGQRPLFP